LHPNLIETALKEGDIRGGRNYLRAVIEQINNDTVIVGIDGGKTSVEAAIAGCSCGENNVCGFNGKWRARNDSNVRPSDS
jgi:site-specific DNA recombinase